MDQNVGSVSWKNMPTVFNLWRLMLYFVKDTWKSVNEFIISLIFIGGYELWACVYLCVCYTSVLYHNGCACQAVFCIQVSLDLSYTVFYGNYGISKHKGTSLWKFVPNSRPRKLGHSTSTVTKRSHRAIVDNTWRQRRTWPSAVNRWPTIVACWSHSASDSVCSVMVDWASKSVHQSLSVWSLVNDYTFNMCCQSVAPPSDKVNNSVFHSHNQARPLHSNAHVF